MRISDWSSDVCSSDLLPFSGACVSLAGLAGLASSCSMPLSPKQKVEVASARGGQGEVGRALLQQSCVRRIDDGSLHGLGQRYRVADRHQQTEAAAVENLSRQIGRAHV